MDDDALAEVIGANVRRERLARGLTQDALADACGVRKPHLSRLENARGLPNIGTLRKVAEALGVPICTLIDPPPEPKPKKGKA